MAVNPVGPTFSQPIQTQPVTGRSLPVSRTPDLARGFAADTAPGSSGFRGRALRLSARISDVERSSIRVNRAADELDSVSGLLEELDQLVSSLRSSVKPAAAGAQQRIDEIVDTISKSTALDHTSNASRSSRPFQIINQSPGVENLQLQSNLQPGQSLDVNIDVTASAQTAGFLLSFGGPALNLGGAGQSDGAASLFVIDITGSLGTQQLSYASGMSVNDIATSINSFTSATGVSATVSGTGVVLRSDFGSNEFVSVNIPDNGAINTAVAQAGLYTLLPDNNNAADVAGLTLFSAATSPLTDQGQDIAALINGVASTGQGRTLTLNLPELTGTVLLTAPFAQRSSADGPFLAFTAQSTAVPKPTDDSDEHDDDKKIDKDNQDDKRVDRRRNRDNHDDKKADKHDRHGRALISDLSALRIDPLRDPGGAIETIGSFRASVTQRRAAVDAQRQSLASQLSALMDQMTALTPAPTRPAGPPLSPQRTAQLLRMDLFSRG